MNEKMNAVEEEEDVFLFRRRLTLGRVQIAQSFNIPFNILLGIFAYDSKIPTNVYGS